MIMNDSFTQAVNNLNDISEIAQNPDTKSDKILSAIDSLQVSVNTTPNPLSTLLDNPNIDNFKSSITNQILNTNVLSSNVDNVTLGISNALDRLYTDNALTDNILNSFNINTGTLVYNEISNTLDSLLGQDLNSLYVKNDILDSISGILNSLTSSLNTPTNDIAAPQGLSAEQCPAINLTSSDLSLNSLLSAAYTDQDSLDTRTTPTDPTIPAGLSVPNNRIITPIGVEPSRPYLGRYPFNKSYTSESGHLKEIDDTPGQERLLDQHACGTYQEMHANGDHVLKVIGDNYTAVAGANKISIEGDAYVHVSGRCKLVIGESITIIADGGFNLVSKGDFRVKAKSINFESTSGDINLKSAADTYLSTSNELHTSSKANHFDSQDFTSFLIGGDMIMDSGSIGITSRSDSNIVGTRDFNVMSNKINIKGSGGPVNIDGTLTNIQVGEAADAKSSTTINSKSSNGSGIVYAPNPDDDMMAADDDPEAMANTIRNGLKTGSLTVNDLNVPSASNSDTDTTDNGVNGTNVSTIHGLGPNPPDNLALSPHYKLYDVTKHTNFPYPVVAQVGLTTTQIVQNLQLVAINILEKVRIKYPDLYISSSFRPAGHGATNSQHYRGQAVDMQFRNGNSPSRCFEIAQWIKQNVAFDQLILEYSPKSGGCWVHCSYNGSGNRSYSNPYKVCTMKGGKYIPGLHLY